MGMVKEEEEKRKEQNRIAQWALMERFESTMSEEEKRTFKKRMEAGEE